jgi:hypothetical protein
MLPVTLPRSQLFACAALILSGCVTAPTGPEVDPEDYLDALAQRARSEATVLIGDGCVISDQPGRDDIVIRDASIQIGKAAADGLQRAMEGHRAAPVAGILPGFCAGAEALDADRRVRIADTETRFHRNKRVRDSFLGDRDEALSLHYYQLLERVKRRALSDSRAEYGARALELPDTTLEQIRSDAGTELAWVYRVFGIAVDDRAAARARFGTNSFSRFGTGQDGVSEDGRILNQDDEDTYGYVVALIDLNSGDMLWFKRSTKNLGDPRTPEVFYQSWANKALKPFFPR